MTDKARTKHETGGKKEKKKRGHCKNEEKEKAVKK